MILIFGDVTLMHLRACLYGMYIHVCMMCVWSYIYMYVCICIYMYTNKYIM